MTTRVLIVEDEPDLADPLAYLLRREGYEVEIAEDGQAALTAFRERGADIILLDLMLPGMPGTEVCRIVRTTSTVPIIMLTAKDSEVDIVVGLVLDDQDAGGHGWSPFRGAAAAALLCFFLDFFRSAR